MHKLHSRRFDTRKLALTATLAGIYAVFRLIPLSKFVGLPGTLTASGMAVPILALLLDPALGILAIIIGTVIGFVSPNNLVRFAGLDFLPGAVNLLIVSLAIRGRRGMTSLLFLGIILAFIATPHTTVFVGSDLWSPPLPYFWLHLAAFFLLISPLSKNIPVRLSSERYRDVVIAIATVAFAGTMAEHLTGGVLFAVFYPSLAEASWRFIYFPWYPIERAVMVAGAVLVCSPVVRNVRSIRESVVLERILSKISRREAR